MMEPTIRKIKLANPYVVSSSKDIFGFYEVSVRWADGTREIFSSMEEANSYIDKRKFDQSLFEKECPAGIVEAIKSNQHKSNINPDPEIEKDSFSLKLIGFADGKKISVIKVIREITGKGLKESKEMVTNLPYVLYDDVDKNTIESAKVRLEEAGAKVEVK